MRLSHQVSLRFVGRLSTQLVGLARAMALARLMPQEQFGVYGQGMLIATFLSPYVVMGLESTVPYFLTRLSARRQSGLIWATGAYLSAAGLLAAAALALLGDRLTAHWGGAGLGDLIPLIATILAFWQLPALVAPVLQTRHRPVLAALTQPAIELPLAAAVVATYWQMGDLRAVFAVIAVFRALHFAVSWYLLRLPFRGEDAEFDTALAGEVARYTLPLGAASLIGTTNAVFDRMLIGWRFGPEEFAVYRTGAYELPFVALFVASVFPVLLPEMARMANDGRFDEQFDCIEDREYWIRLAAKGTLGFIDQVLLTKVEHGDENLGRQRLRRSRGLLEIADRFEQSFGQGLDRTTARELRALRCRAHQMALAAQIDAGDHAEALRHWRQAWSEAPIVSRQRLQLLRRTLDLSATALSHRVTLPATAA